MFYLYSQIPLESEKFKKENPSIGEEFFEKFGKRLQFLWRLQKKKNIAYSSKREPLERSITKLPKSPDIEYVIEEEKGSCYKDGAPHGECEYHMGISGCYYAECPKQKIAIVDMFVNFLKDNANDMCIDYDKMAEKQEKFAQMLFKNTRLETWYTLVPMG